MPAEGRLGILIEGRDQLSQVLGRASQSVQQYDREVAKLKRTNDQSIEGQAKLGAKILEQQAAHERLRNILKKTDEATNGLNGKVQALASVMSGLPGPAGAAASKVASLASSMGAASGAAGTFALGAVAAVAAGAAIGAMFIGLAKQAADYQEHIDLVTERSGLLTREWGALKVAAAANATSIDLVERSLDFFVNKIKEASQEGSDAEKVFLSMGVSVRDSAGHMRATGDILRGVQAYLNAIQDPAIKSGLAMDLFGNRSARALRVLTAALDENGKLAESRGVIFSAETAEKLHRVDTAFDNLSLSVAGLKNQLAALVALSFEPLLAGFSAFVQKVQDFANDPKVQAVLSAMAMFNRLAGQKGPTVYAGRDAIPEEGGRPGISARQAIDFGAAQNTRMFGPFLDAVQKARVDAENSFNDGVLELAKKRQEAEYKAMSEAFERVSPRFATTISGVSLGGVEKPSLKDPLAESRDDWAVMMEEAKDRGKQLNDEADALEKVNGETQKRIQKIDEERKKVSLSFQITKDANDAIRSGVRGFFTDAISGTVSLKQAFFNLIESVLQQIVIAAATHTVLHALGIPVQSGGTFLQGGGSIAAMFSPVYAQTGLVTRGVRGLDSVPAMVGRGERIVSHVQNDFELSVAGRMDRFMDSMSRTFSGGERGSGSPIHLHYHEVPGGGSDRQGLMTWLARDVMPIQRELARRGAHR